MINFNLNKPKSETTIVVAMSGGVDSSTVAAMLHHEGYKVIGITLQLYDHAMTISRKGACCAGQDIYDAKMVAEKLGIPHYVLDYESRFKQSVIDDFVDSYLRGETPLPCVRCNQSVKFKDLMQVAKDLKADGLATGHYVRKIYGSSGPELHKGLDEQKDQSYFLFATTKEQLEYLHFPLGGLTKNETRDLAAKFNLLIADKPDSQDICFVPDGNYRNIVTKINPNANQSGLIVHIDGFELGRHSGIINYTVGQRKGLGISFPEPLYVIKIDPVTKIVYVGPQSALNAHQFIIKEVNWLGAEEEFDAISANYDTPESAELEIKVKIRSTRPGIFAKITKIDKDKVKVRLLSDEKAVTPGQACVIYQNSRVLGGGWITREIE